MFGEHSRVIMASDLNSKHHDLGSYLCTPNGNHLHRFTNSNRVMVIGPDKPTYYPAYLNAHPDILDIVAVKGIICLVYVSSISELSSDHCHV